MHSAQDGYALSHPCGCEAGLASSSQCFVYLGDSCTIPSQLAEGNKKQN